MLITATLMVVIFVPYQTSKASSIKKAKRLSISSSLSVIAGASNILGGTVALTGADE